MNRPGLRSMVVLCGVFTVLTPVLTPMALAQSAPAARGDPLGEMFAADARQRFAAIEQKWTAHIAALTAGFDQPYPDGYDFTPLLLRLERADPRVLALANFVITMPQYAKMGEVFNYTAQLAERFDVMAPAVRTLQSNQQLALTNANADFNNAAIARALQAASDGILRLQARAASGADPQAAQRFAQLVELAHSTLPLQQFMQLSAQHHLVRQRLTARFERLAALPDQRQAEYIDAFQIVAVRLAVSSANLEQAKASTADAQRALNRGLAQLGRQQFLDLLGSLLTDEPSPPPQRRKVCRDVYSAPEVFTDYNGNVVSNPGYRTGEECTEF